jgi:hypothetical protein
VGRFGERVIAGWVGRFGGTPVNEDGDDDGHDDGDNDMMALIYMVRELLVVWVLCWEIDMSVMIQWKFKIDADLLTAGRVAGWSVEKLQKVVGRMKEKEKKKVEKF